MGRGLFYIGGWLISACAFGAEAVQLTPQSVQKIGASEFQITWTGQGTLMCNGAASIPTFRVPDDLAFGQWLECHVALSEGNSNQVRILCHETACTAHIGREKHEFDIKPLLATPSEAPRLIVEEIVTEVEESHTGVAIPDGYALQLAARRERAALEALVAEYGFKDVRIYAVESAGDPYFVLIYGFYRSLESATEAGRSMPNTLPKPWVRTTKDLRASMRPE